MDYKINILDNLTLSITSHKSDPDSSLIDEIDEKNGFEEDISYDNDESLTYSQDEVDEAIEEINEQVRIKEQNSFLERSKRLKKECTCNSRDLFNFGCRCGYLKSNKV